MILEDEILQFVTEHNTYSYNMSVFACVTYTEITNEFNIELKFDNHRKKTNTNITCHKNKLKIIECNDGYICAVNELLNPKAGIDEVHIIWNVVTLAKVATSTWPHSETSFVKRTAYPSCVCTFYDSIIHHNYKPAIIELRNNLITEIIFMNYGKKHIPVTHKLPSSISQLMHCKNTSTVFRGLYSRIPKTRYTTLQNLITRYKPTTTWTWHGCDIDSEILSNLTYPLDDSDFFTLTMSCN